MRRRDFIVAIGGAAAWPLAAPPLAAPPLAASAQQPQGMRRIGWLSPGSTTRLSVPFVEALREVGWIERRNLLLEFRWADNDADRLAQMAAELVRLQMDIIVAAGTLGPLAVKRATTTIPIVMSSAGDPLGSGLVASLARPGGNVTGLSLMAPDLGGKRLEILKELLPTLSRVAVLWNVANPYPALVFRETESAARKLGIEVRSLEVRAPRDVEGALQAALRQDAGALITVEDPLTLTYRREIADFASKHGLPCVSGLREYAEAGVLFSYGSHLPDLMRRTAGYVDKILKGAKPADLPVEQPTKFQLVFNVKTAKALGLEIPPTLLARADEVIE